MQEISIAQNLQLKARAQCSYRKMQNKYMKIPSPTHPQKRTNRAHQDMPATTPWTINYHIMDNHTIYEEKRTEQQQGKKGEKTLRLLTVPSIHKHFVK